MFEGVTSIVSIILVDPFYDFEELLKEGLGSHVRILQAVNGEAALNHLRELKPKVSAIIADDKATLKDGSNLLVKVHEEYSHVARICVSGGSDLENFASLVNEANITRVIPKPVNTDYFVKHVSEALEVSSSIVTQKENSFTESHIINLMKLKIASELEPPVLGLKATNKILDDIISRAADSKKAPLPYLEDLSKAKSHFDLFLSRIKIVNEHLSSFGLQRQMQTFFSDISFNDLITHLMDSFPFQQGWRTRICLDFDNDVTICGHLSLLEIAMINILNYIFTYNHMEDSEVKIWASEDEHNHIIHIENKGAINDKLLYEDDRGLKHARRIMLSHAGHFEIRRLGIEGLSFTLAFPVPGLITNGPVLVHENAKCGNS